MAITIYNNQGGIGPVTTFMLGPLRQMTDFSATTFCRIQSGGNSEFVYAPDDVLPLILERNTAEFAVSMEKKIKSGMSYETLKEILNPLHHGPQEVLNFLSTQFAGHFEEIDFYLPSYVGGWGRQFGQAGYEALRSFYGSFLQDIRSGAEGLETEIFHALLAQFDLPPEISFSFTFQRFLEGDEERYFFSTLGIGPEMAHDRLILFEGLQRYLQTGPSDFERQMLWIAMRSIRNGGIVSPTHEHINIDWIDGVADKSCEEAFYFIENHTIGEVCREEITRVDSSIGTKISEPIAQKIDTIIDIFYGLSEEKVSLDGMSMAEQEILIAALQSIWKKPHKKQFLIEYVCVPFFEMNKHTRIAPQIICCLWENKLGGAYLETYIQSCSLEDVMEICDHIRDNGRRKDFIITAKKQTIAILAKVRSGEIVQYARFVHHVTQKGGAKPAFDMLMGIGSFCPHIGTVAKISSPFLPEKKPGNLIRETVKKVGDALLAFGGRSHEKALMQAVERGGELRESLLSIFGDGYYPIGGKIHFSEPLSEEKTKLLHQIVGFGNTPFQLLHANNSMNLPPCQSPLQLIAILYQLEKLGIIQDKNLQLQLSIAGQLPNKLASLSGSACIFAKPQAIQYKKEAFLTSHNSDTATCIMCYDAGVLDREGFPNMPPQILGRTDMLGFSQISEAITYFLIGNMMAQFYFGGKFQTIGSAFRDDYLDLLRNAGLAGIIQKKWVHKPDDIETPEAEEEHYQVVKVCTDILTKDIENYRDHGRADGFSFQVKKLLHDYIVRYNLLPLGEQWVKNYLRYLHYQTSLPAEVVHEKLTS